MPLRPRVTRSACARSVFSSSRPASSSASGSSPMGRPTACSSSTSFGFTRVTRGTSTVRCARRRRPAGLGGQGAHRLDQRRREQAEAVVGNHDRVAFRSACARAFTSFCASAEPGARGPSRIDAQHLLAPRVLASASTRVFVEVGPSTERMPESSAPALQSSSAEAPADLVVSTRPTACTCAPRAQRFMIALAAQPASAPGFVADDQPGASR